MQPPQNRAASRLTWIAIAGLWANAIYWSIGMVERARLPQTYDGYRYRNGGVPADWVFPAHDVATWIGVMAVEALVVSVLLRRVTDSIAGACLSFGLLYGIGCFVMVPLSMHAVATFSTHAISLLFAAGWLIAMGIVSIVVILVVRIRRAASTL